MTHSVRRHLDVAVEEYDAAIRRFIPDYERMIHEAARSVATTRPRRVLDLGAGTGALSAELLTHPEVGTVVLLDVDPEMLGQAARRLAAWDGRVEFLEASFDGPLPSVDAVVASLALHHVPDLVAKTALYRRVRTALPDGGLFVIADVITPGAEGHRAGDYEAWTRHMEAGGISGEEARAHLASWAGEDTYFSLEDEMTALTEAGFHPQCLWRNAPSTVVMAVALPSGAGA